MHGPAFQPMLKTLRALSLVAVFGVAVFLGCSQDRTLPTAPKNPSQISAARGVSPSAQAIAHAVQVKARYWERLKHHPGVFGMGISWDKNGSVFIGVTVDKEQVGAIAGIEREVDGIPVRVDVTGRPKFFAPKPPPPPPIYMGTSSGLDQACGGGGTAGCVLVSGRKHFFLSCAHVWAPGNGNIGAEVTDPERRPPACNPQPIIGTLWDFTPLTSGGIHTMDAAIVLAGNKLNYTTQMISGYTPTSTVTPESVGLAVKKTGARTGPTSGTVTMIHYDIAFGGYGFTDQMFIGTQNFALPGDSGALVVTEAENNPVGIVIGGDDAGGTFTIATPIQRILDRFGATVAP